MELRPKLSSFKRGFSSFLAILILLLSLSCLQLTKRKKINRNFQSLGRGFSNELYSTDAISDICLPRVFKFPSNATLRLINDVNTSLNRNIFSTLVKVYNLLDDSITESCKEKETMIYYYSKYQNHDKNSFSQQFMKEVEESRKRASQNSRLLGEKNVAVSWEFIKKPTTFLNKRIESTKDRVHHAIPGYGTYVNVSPQIRVIVSMFDSIKKHIGPLFKTPLLNYLFNFLKCLQEKSMNENLNQYAKVLSVTKKTVMMTSGYSFLVFKLICNPEKYKKAVTFLRESFNTSDMLKKFEYFGRFFGLLFNLIGSY